MTSKAYILTKLIIDSMWKLATDWMLPGLNFNFATFMLGLVIIGVVLAMLGDFLVHFGVKPFDSRVDDSAERMQARKEKAYADQEAAWWAYYDRKYGD